MSGFAYSISASGAMFAPKSTVPQAIHGIEYIDNNRSIPPSDEAAGSVGKFLGIIAAIAMPFAAPAIFSAVAGSGILGAGLASAAASGTIGALTSTLGSAIVGGVLNAGIAYASGARGAAVWQAAGMGALSGGIGGMTHAASLAATSSSAGIGASTGVPAAASTAATSATAPGVLSGLPVGGGGTGGVLSAGGQVLSAGAAPTISSTIANGITSIMGNIGTQAMNRIGAILINAAVNGQSMGRLDGLVAQQKAELEALKSRDLAAYNQRISAAQQIMAAADRADPQHTGLMRMADVAGMDENQFRQAMRNIAVRQGGSFDTGQQKAYERGAALQIARDKARAYNQGTTEGTALQNSLRAQGAGLLGPDTAGFQNWQAGVELDAAKERAHREADNSTAGGIAAGLFGTQYNPSTSPDPSAPQNGNSDDNSLLGGVFRSFGGGHI